MRGDETSRNLSTSAALLVELARDEVGAMSARRRAEGFAELNARLSPRKRRMHLFLRLAALLAVVALALIGRRWLRLHPTDTLSYAIEDGQIGPTGAIEAIGTSEPLLRFSDGTQVVFFGGAHGRVRSVDEHGAHIALTGRVHVDVVPWRGSHWLFDAGPFLITVKGTAFTAEWRDAEERLEVVLKTGTVAVSGPVSEEAITLRAGQQLIISAREKEVVIRDIDSIIEEITASSVSPWPPRGNVNNGQDAPPPQPEMQQPKRPARRSAASTAAPAIGVPAPRASNWTAELAAGRFAIILQQATQRGLEPSLAEVSSDDLAALADAARYSRLDDVARRALLAQRRRFPQSARANDAAFLLGRLEEAAQHPEIALAWYDRCLTESTHGTYTSEALGRKLTVVQRLYGAARARPMAEEYLRRFGNGTYAAAARALTRAP